MARPLKAPSRTRVPAQPGKDSRVAPVLTTAGRGRDRVVRPVRRALPGGRGHHDSLSVSLPRESPMWDMTAQMIAFRHGLRSFASMYRVLSPPTR